MDRGDRDDVLALAEEPLVALGLLALSSLAGGTKEVADVAVAELAGEAEEFAHVGERLAARLAEGDEVRGVARTLEQAGQQLVDRDAIPEAGVLVDQLDAEVEQRLLRDLRLADPAPDRPRGLADDVEQGLVA